MLDNFQIDQDIALKFSPGWGLLLVFLTTFGDRDLREINYHRLIEKILS